MSHNHLLTSGNGKLNLTMPNPEVTPRAKRRTFSAEFRLRILEKAGARRTPTERGALLRREELYSSHLTHWRRGGRGAGNPEQHQHGEQVQQAYPVCSAVHGGSSFRAVRAAFYAMQTSRTPRWRTFILLGTLNTKADLSLSRAESQRSAWISARFPARRLHARVGRRAVITASGFLPHPLP
jgi:hypothetical protein